jgi:hypothetical protein
MAGGGGGDVDADEQPAPPGSVEREATAAPRKTIARRAGVPRPPPRDSGDLGGLPLRTTLIYPTPLDRPLRPPLIPAPPAVVVRAIAGCAALLLRRPEPWTGAAMLLRRQRALPAHACVVVSVTLRSEQSASTAAGNDAARRSPSSVRGERHRLTAGGHGREGGRPVASAVGSSRRGGPRRRRTADQAAHPSRARPSTSSSTASDSSRTPPGARRGSADGLLQAVVHGGGQHPQGVAVVPSVAAAPLTCLASSGCSCCQARKQG